MLRSKMRPRRNRYGQLTRPGKSRCPGNDSSSQVVTRKAKTLGEAEPHISFSHYDLREILWNFAYFCWNLTFSCKLEFL